MDNMNMENVENMEHSNKNNRKESCLKYLTIFLGTIVGAFLAFYFVADYTVKSLLNPEHQIRRAEKMMKKMDKEIAREFDKNIFLEIVNQLKQQNAQLKKEYEESQKELKKSKRYNLDYNFWDKKFNPMPSCSIFQKQNNF